MRIDCRYDENFTKIMVPFFFNELGEDLQKEIVRELIRLSDGSEAEWRELLAEADELEFSLGHVELVMIPQLSLDIFRETKGE